MSDQTARNKAELAHFLRLGVALDMEGDYLVLAANAQMLKAADQIEQDAKRIAELEAALLAAQELFEKALPKFNWGASCLDNKAIKLLNDVPIIVGKALAKFDARKG